VKFKDLIDRSENPTLCLHPMRVFNECHKCEIFKRAYQRDRIKQLKCKPHISNEVMDLLKRKRELLNELTEINNLLNQ